MNAISNLTVNGRIERFGRHTLVLADSREWLAGLDVDAVVSDPPYGMDWNTDSTRFTGGVHKRGDGRDDWGDIDGDDEPFDPSPLMRFREVVLWGANHYAQRLPVGSTLVWIKKPPHLYGTFLSDAEIRWRKGGHGVYVHYKQFPPPSRIAENDGRAVAHPTQKPISLMEWCLQGVKGKIILDPYMGSATTGIACHRMGRDFIGIERNPKRFDVACERMARVVSQPDMFVDLPSDDSAGTMEGLL